MDSDDNRNVMKRLALTIFIVIIVIIIRFYRFSFPQIMREVFAHFINYFIT